MQKLISIIIVNYNGEKWLKGCLTSLENQSYKNFEIIFVDNHSSDKSLAIVRGLKPKFSRLKIVVNKRNFGFAEGNNIGYMHAKGEYLVLLNTDTIVKRDYLENFIQVFNEYPNAGIAQSKLGLLKDPQIIDSCGSYWTDTTFMYYIGNGKKSDVSLYNKSFLVFSVKGASMLIKRELIEKVGLFDPDFWSYYEETDLCHRAWLAGWESVYWPKTVCYHAVGGTSLNFPNEVVQFHNFKNKLLSFIKNFEIKTLIFVLLIFLMINISISFVWLVQRRYRLSVALLKGIVWNVKNLNETLEKRSTVQKLRKQKDSRYLAHTKKNPKLSYYYFLFNDRLSNF